MNHPDLTAKRIQPAAVRIMGRFWVASLAGVCALVLYVLTLAPDMVGGDAGEFQFVPYVLGIPHHTGYPLYTLLGKVWSLVPLGSVAFRMNLLSAIFAAVTVAIVCLVAADLTGKLAPALLASASLAVTQLFWLWGTVAGVRSSTALVTALLLYLAIRWQSKSADDPNGREARRAFLWLALAYGASLAHHRSAILLALPLALFVLAVNARMLLSVRTVGMSVLLFVLPLLTYLYLPIRSIMGSPFDQFHPDTLPRFLDLVLATRLSESFFSVPQAEMPARMSMFAGDLSGEFGLAGVALGCLGVLWLLFRNPPAFGLTILFVASVITQTLNWNVGEDRLNVVYLIPAYVTFSLWVAGGARLLGGVLSRLLGLLSLRGLACTAVAVPLLVPFVQMGVANWDGITANAMRPLDKFRQNLNGGYAARRLVAASLPYVEDDAVIFGDWEQATPFWYAQQVEGIKRGVEVVYGVDSMEEIEKRAGERPTYLARAYPDPGTRRFSSVGPLVKLVRAPSHDAPPNLDPLNYVFGSQMALLGYLQYDDRGHFTGSESGDLKVLAIALYWKALTQLQTDYSVSLRLVDSDGKDVAQLDNKHPVLSLYPTTRWIPGEVVGDYYELSLQGLAPGVYRAEVIVYGTTARGWSNLPVQDASGRSVGERANIVSVTVR